MPSRALQRIQGKREGFFMIEAPMPISPIDIGPAGIVSISPTRTPDCTSYNSSLAFNAIAGMSYERKVKAIESDVTSQILESQRPVSFIDFVIREVEVTDQFGRKVRKQTLWSDNFGKSIQEATNMEEKDGQVWDVTNRLSDRVVNTSGESWHLLASPDEGQSDDHRLILIHRRSNDKVREYFVTIKSPRMALNKIVENISGHNFDDHEDISTRIISREKSKGESPILLRDIFNQFNNALDDKERRVRRSFIEELERDTHLSERELERRKEGIERIVAGQIKEILKDGATLSALGVVAQSIPKWAKRIQAVFQDSPVSSRSAREATSVNWKLSVEQVRADLIPDPLRSDLIRKFETDYREDEVIRSVKKRSFRSENTGLKYNNKMLLVDHKAELREVDKQFVGWVEQIVPTFITKTDAIDRNTASLVKAEQSKIVYPVLKPGHLKEESPIGGYDTPVALALLAQSLAAFVYENNTGNEDVYPTYVNLQSVRHPRGDQDGLLAGSVKSANPLLRGITPPLTSGIEVKHAKESQEAPLIITQIIQPNRRVIKEHKLNHPPTIANPLLKYTTTQQVVFERVSFDWETIQKLYPWARNIKTLESPKKSPEGNDGKGNLDRMLTIDLSKTGISQTQPFQEKTLELREEADFSESSISESAEALIAELTNILQLTKKPDRGIGNHARKKEAKKTKLRELEDEVITLGWKTLYILLNHFTQEASVRRLAILLAAYKLPQATDELHGYLSALIYRELQEVKTAKKETLPPAFIRKITELTKKASPLEERLEELKEGVKKMLLNEDMVKLKAPSSRKEKGPSSSKRISVEVNRFLRLHKIRLFLIFILLNMLPFKKEEKEKLYTALRINLEKIKRPKKGAVGKGKTKTKPSIDDILFEIGGWRKVRFLPSIRKNQTKKNPRTFFPKSGIIYRYQPFCSVISST